MDASLLEATVNANHHDPFGFLGHDGDLVVRAFLPGTVALWLMDARTSDVAAAFVSVHESELFAAWLRACDEPFLHYIRVHHRSGNFNPVEVPAAGHYCELLNTGSADLRRRECRQPAGRSRTDAWLWPVVSCDFAPAGGSCPWSDHGAVG